MELREEKGIHTICLIAISSDFFDIFLPNPVPFSELVDFTGFLIKDSGKCEEVLRESTLSTTCPLRPLPGGSAIRPLLTIGEECLLVILPVFEASKLPFTVVEPLGLDLPAERGLSGKVVLRFGGVSWEKSV